MPEGLQVWDASGNLINDVGTRMGRFLGVVTVVGTGATNAGSIIDVGLATGTPWAIVTQVTDDVTDPPDNAWITTVTFDTALNKMSWIAEGSSDGSVFGLTINYGVR